MQRLLPVKGKKSAFSAFHAFECYGYSDVADVELGNNSLQYWKNLTGVERSMSKKKPDPCILESFYLEIWFELELCYHKIQIESALLNQHLNPSSMGTCYVLFPTRHGTSYNQINWNHFKSTGEGPKYYTTYKGIITHTIHVWYSIFFYTKT